MAKGLNKVFLLGAVGKDLRFEQPNQVAWLRAFSLATSDRVKKNEVWEEETTWHNLVAFARTAEVVRDYVKKGTQLLVEGKIQTRSWDDKQSGEKKYKTEILVNELTLLGGKSESPDNGQKSSGRTQPTTTRSAAAAPTRTQAAPATRTVVADDSDPFGDGTGIGSDDIPDF